MFPVRWYMRVCAVFVALLAASTGSTAAQETTSAAPVQQLLPAPVPLFATQAARGHARTPTVGKVIGVSGLRKVGVGTTVAFRCVRACTGTFTARVRASGQYQLRLRPPVAVSRASVVEITARRPGRIGWWQRFGFVRSGSVLFARARSAGCLQGAKPITCPSGVPATAGAGGAPPASVPATTVVDPLPTPVLGQSVAFVSPGDQGSVAGTVRLVANATGVAGIEWQMYAADDPSKPETRSWRVLGRDLTPTDGFTLEWDTTKVKNQGSSAAGTVVLAAIGLDAAGQQVAVRDFRRVTVLNYDLTGDGYVGCADLNVMKSQYGGAGSADINRDGVVNIFDLSILLSNFAPPPGEGQCPS